MKILVLSHTRSGSTMLCKWLSKELNIELDETPFDINVFDSVFQKENIIRKILTESCSLSNETINKFDKVIFLTRENSIDSAISFIVTDNRNWHVDYEITSDWINDNKNEIFKEFNKYNMLKLKMEQYDGFHVTYEDIYINKKSVNTILDYLNINSPKYLDMLEYTKRYRKDGIIVSIRDIHTIKLI
jgi:LPS sulfotransferase NodH